MAEYNQSSTVTESPGVFYPQDYFISKLNLISSNGKQLDLKKILIEMSYYEDIYTFSASGHVSVVDAQGFIELLQLTGNDFIEIEFGKVKNAPNMTKKTFRVYKTGNRTPSGNLNIEGYTLYFCSEELMLSEQIKVSKSYNGQKISYIVNDILKEKLKVESKNIEKIEETTGMYDFVVPKMKPFEAISWVSTYARPQKHSDNADMLFFETKNGYNFRSLQSMYKDDVYATYKYQIKNLDNKTEPSQEKSINVLDYEFTKTYDIMNEIYSGTFANRLISIDPLTRSFNVTDFDYLKSEMEKLNNNSVFNDLKNRLGKSLNQNPNGLLKVVTGNANESSLPYIKEKESGFAKDIAIETYVPKRTASISLANYTTIKIAIPGDPGITAGRTIQFNLLSLKPTDTLKQLDKFYSGKYLVTAVRHIIENPSTYQTILEIAKERPPNSYTQSNNSDMAVRGCQIMKNFIGKDGFYWWLGVVEDRNDPLGLGRVRVRMFGHHTDNLQEVPTDTLSWALPCLAPNGTMTDGTPLVGDYAFGFFTDGMSSQAPVIIGVFPGIPKNGPNPSKGFSEGSFYPVGEPTTSRLHRNEKISQTPIGYHDAHLDTNVPTASGGSWSEPKSQYNAKIPYNRVTETEAGHVFELDDTPGHERVHLAHKANTFFEIAPDGSKVTKVSGKNYEIYLSDNNVHIKGACNITVDGNANLYVKGNVVEKIDGTFTGATSSWNLTGDVNINGQVNATGDVIGGGISLDGHVHQNPQGGTTGLSQ